MTRDRALPPWIARDERERQAMIDWANAKLAAEDAAEALRLLGNADPNAPYSPPPPEHAEKYYKWRAGGGLERAAADAGVSDLARALVRSRWPHIADLVQLPPLKRGKKYATGRGNLIRKGRIADAAKDVKRVKAHWQAHYGKTRRRQSDGPSAVEIAAARNGVSAAEVEERLKRIPPGK